MKPSREILLFTQSNNDNDLHPLWLPPCTLSKHSVVVCVIRTGSAAATPSLTLLYIRAADVTDVCESYQSNCKTVKNV